MSAESVFEFDPADGVLMPPVAGEAGSMIASDTRSGLSRYIDAQTELLGHLSSTWFDFQQMRKAAAQRGLSDVDIAVLQHAEDHFAKSLKKALRRHPLWPWLSQHPGTGGVHVARLLARIGDPRRFPGQQCDRGHTFAPDGLLRSDGGVACPFTDVDGERCPGRVLPPRPGTGTRSVWHYLGLHVVDGRSPRRMKGQQADWDPIGRTSVLQPDGIADQIIKHRIEPWRGIYDAKKARLTAERGAETGPGSDHDHGPRSADDPAESDSGCGGAGADRSSVIESRDGLRPFQIHAIARKVSAKAFVGDLLAEWKQLSGAGVALEIDARPGPGQSRAAA